MQVVNLNLPYKGERDYLHGTDIYTETVRVLNGVKAEALTGKCRLVIHNVARRQCQLLYTLLQDTTKRPENLIAEFNFISDTVNLVAWLVETSEDISHRIPYAESQITENCILSDRSIKLSCRTRFSAIEELVAMNKLLHITKYPPGESRWYFTRMDLDRLLTVNDVGNLQVTLQQNLNNRLTRSEVISHDQIIGHIYFSMVTM